MLFQDEITGTQIFRSHPIGPKILTFLHLGWQILQSNKHRTKKGNQVSSYFYCAKANCRGSYGIPKPLGGSTGISLVGLGMRN